MGILQKFGVGCRGPLDHRRIWVKQDINGRDLVFSCGSISPLRVGTSGLTNSLLKNLDFEVFSFAVLSFR
ncbi:MAG: hypothetical protein WA197_23335 [Candidatus Acidiferrales bacterium]